MVKNILLSEAVKLLKQNQALFLYRADAFNRLLVKTTLEEELNNSKAKRPLWILPLAEETLTLVDLVNKQPEEAYFVKDYPRDFAVGAPFCRLEQR